MSAVRHPTPIDEGSVFIVPAAESLFGACRVVRQERLGWVVVLYDGFWRQPPSLGEILSRPALIRGNDEARTVAGAPPKSFHCAGHAPLRLSETQVIVPPTPFQKWETLAEELAQVYRCRDAETKSGARKRKK